MVGHYALSMSIIFVSILICIGLIIGGFLFVIKSSVKLKSKVFTFEECWLILFTIFLLVVTNFLVWLIIDIGNYFGAT